MLSTSRKESMENAQMSDATPAKRATCSDGSTDEMVTDPVCGMKVKRTPGSLSAEHAGTIYYFCSEACRKKFLADPKRYAEYSKRPVTAGAPAGAKGSAQCRPEIV